jgi:transcriptional regulator with XRE-family HTH domain
MSISQEIISQADNERIAAAEFAYFAARNRRKIYSAIIKEFKKSKLTQAQLARRMGQRSDVICRWLSGPGNYTLDTVSGLLLGISNSELSYSIAHPFTDAPRNFVLPNWAVERSNVDDNVPPPPDPRLGEENRFDKSDSLMLGGRR